MNTSRVRTLDALRGLAAVAVVLFHFNQVRARDHSLYDTLNAWGWLGVTVFFVLSGYCVQRATAREPTARQFLLRRFARIYPGYFASVIVVLVFCVARKFVSGLNDYIALPKTMSGWIATATITTAPVSNTPPINWVYWSLSFELAFYLVLALAVAWTRLRVALPLLLCALALFPPIVPAIFFLHYWGLFCLGIALALFRRTEWRGPALLAFLSLVVICRQQIWLEVAAAIATSAVIALAPQIDRMGGRALRVLAELGGISYALYLLHVPVGVWLVLRFADAHGGRSGGLALRLACDGLALGVCLLAAALFHRWIEQPGINWGRRVAA